MQAVDQAERLIAERGRIHLMGIGGIGMAGVAGLLHERGLQVSGCDLRHNRQTEWLACSGIHVEAGHGESHLDASFDWLVRSTAVPESHPEICRAKSLGIPVLRRGEVLPALMRDRTGIAVCGTHGKTTTAAMIAQILDCGYCIGGEIVGTDAVARDGNPMVVEADESDGTVAGYTPDYTVVTNIEYDHMEHHASEAAFIGCFERIIENTRQRVYYCADDPIAVRLCSENPKCESFRLPVVPIALPIPGRHNQWNSAAARAVAGHWKSDLEILQALEDFRPVRRRFETILDRDGIRIVSDYAHHPTEIAALIQTARELNPGRLLGIFQPHRYTRTLALGPDFPAGFEGLEKLWLVPVYAASEQPLSGGTTDDLAARFPAAWKDRLFNCPSLEVAWADIKTKLQSGDLLLLIGAGDIEKIAEQARTM